MNNPVVAGVTLPLKGIALGNACWGGTATDVNCNGPNSDENDSKMYYGKGLSSDAHQKLIEAECKWPPLGTGASTGKVSLKCEALLEKQHQMVGPHNVYDIYDNCPQGDAYLKQNGLTMRQLLKYKRDLFNNDVKLSTAESSEHHRRLGGYDWACGGMDDTSKWITTPAVMKALHVSNPGASKFEYQRSGPASVTLHPMLAKKLRVLIYNGDSDSCVPYKGNEQWIQVRAPQPAAPDCLTALCDGGDGGAGSLLAALCMLLTTPCVPHRAWSRRATSPSRATGSPGTSRPGPTCQPATPPATTSRAAPRTSPSSRSAWPDTWCRRSSPCPRCPSSRPSSRAGPRRRTSARAGRSLSRERARSPQS